MPTRTLLLLLCALLLTAPPARADEVAGGQASVDSLAAMSREAAASGRLEPLETYAESALSELLLDPAADAGRIVRLQTAREFARYFAGIPVLDEGQRETLAWLADRPALAATLMAAVTDADKPERVLAVLSRLRLDHGDRVADWPDLAAALCVVWDDPPAGRDGYVDPAGAVERASGLFHFYSRAKGRFDLQQLPWALAVFVVDNPLAEADVAYARRRYGRAAAPLATIAADVPWDRAHDLTGAPKRVDALPYTLENLAACGGDVYDRAYYAAGVAKSVGAPAVVFSGAAGIGGEAGAWVGRLEPAGKSARWVFDGRALEASGTATDPQTHAAVEESEVAVLASLQRASAADRLASWAMAKGTDLAPADAEDALLRRAITLCPGNRLAWERLADAASENDGRAAAALAAIGKFAAADYPEFALNLAKRLTAGQPDAARLKAWAAVAALLPARRADLQARVKLERADVLRSAGREEAALAEYGAVLTGPPTAGPAVLLAADAVDALLRGRGEYRRLANVYDFLLRRLPPPPPGAFTRGTPYVSVGNRYADLLDALGESTKAATVRRQLKVYDAAQ